MKNEIANPLLEDLGIELMEWREGHCELGLDVAPRHLNRRGRLQGGVAATLLDVQGSFKRASRAPGPE
ncbi:MAG: PaaI family thioesterase [Burkholderiales bacterium]|nr:PaaI family thioesterase [Burkholderiales bacterium]